ncbi:DUF3142 domain-containing protein [Shewanella acanthi]|uniref:DUF3142 domain-containing protein n=1 Tax=Shewanella acanthi TaxID=2864212 RepID=UPI001C65FDEE|nr:DUF3142 domain-containing protein [Shewanella acanthi]QYJ78128.1 DUF3142 domain-containing protein [Shewanella acanthi]
MTPLSQLTAAHLKKHLKQILFSSLPRVTVLLVFVTFVVIAIFTTLTNTPYVEEKKLDTSHQVSFSDRHSNTPSSKAIQSVTLEHEVYIWQRQWRSEHQTALKQSEAAFSGLRILALQAHPKSGINDSWFEVAVNHQYLKADPRPKIAVIRLDGQLARLDEAQIISHIQQMLRHWQEQGTVIQGIEIDHDSASSKLGAYRGLLQKLRAQLPPTLQLSITALPAWLNSPEFPSLLSHIDELVLQIHSVSDPRKGLFDPIKGAQWVKQVSKISTVPFLIALPSYGSAVYSTDKGFEVESEVALHRNRNGTDKMQELMADPKALQSFIQQLQQRKLPKLKGIIWFRLPLEGDRRIWPLSTLMDVINQKPLVANIELEIGLIGSYSAQAAINSNASHLTAKLYQLALFNRGNVAGILPNKIQLLGTNCMTKDGQNGYLVSTNKDEIVWQLPERKDSDNTLMNVTPSNGLPTEQAATLAPNSRRVIGWACCDSLTLQDIYAP